MATKHEIAKKMSRNDDKFSMPRTKGKHIPFKNKHETAKKSGKGSLKWGAKDKEENEGETMTLGRRGNEEARA